MIRISIQKNSIETNAGQFQTQTEADSWLQQCQANNSFGKNDRWLRSYKDQNGVEYVPDEDISKALESRTITDSPAQEEVSHQETVTNPDQTTTTTTVIDSPAIPAVTHNEYHFAAEYQVVQTDVTAQLAQEAAMQKGLACQSFGASVIAAVWAINEGNTNLTAQDFQSIMQDSTLQMVERLLWNGSLKTARAMIASYSSQYFTQQNISDILAMIDNSGLL